jgi:hypothetical protein
MFILKALVIGGLIRLLVATENHFLCSGLYALAAFIFRMASKGEVVPSLIAAGIAFALSTVYFWALNQLETLGLWWWVVAVLGLVIVFI